jgi:hypothetical protein
MRNPPGFDHAREAGDALALRGRDVRPAGLLAGEVAHREDRRDDREAIEHAAAERVVANAHVAQVHDEIAPGGAERFEHFRGQIAAVVAGVVVV